MTKTSLGRRAAWCVLATFAACSPSTGTTTGDASSSGGAETTPKTTGDPVTDGSGGVQTVTSATETHADTTTAEPTATVADTTGADEGTTTAVDCPAAVEAMAAALTAGPHCDLLLQFDADGAALGWGVVCGDTPADPFSAKSSVQATDCCKDNSAQLNPSETGPFVIYVAADADVDGGLAIVSNNVGDRVFETTLGATGPGTISVPTPWNDAGGLGVGGGCSGDGFVFANVAGYNATLGGNLAQETLSSLVDAIEATVVPAALAGIDVALSVAVAYEPEYMGDTTYLVLLELGGA